MIQRGEIYWVDLGRAVGSRPAKRRPVLVVQAEPYNVSRLATALAVVVTSNTGLATMPGNDLLGNGDRRIVKQNDVIAVPPNRTRNVQKYFVKKAEAG